MSSFFSPSLFFSLLLSPFLSLSFSLTAAGYQTAISKLVAGMKVDDVAALLEGNTCGRRSTSCADQMVRALREAQAAQ